MGTFTPVAANTWYTSTIDTAEVTEWLNGTDSNYGIRIEVDNSLLLGNYFHTKEAASAADRPYLILVFSGNRVYKASAAFSSTADKFIGFATAAADSGDPVDVIINGIVPGLSSLTVGGFYYLSDTFGAISTTPGTNTRKVGIAMSDTELLITNIW